MSGLYNDFSSVYMYLYMRVKFITLLLKYICISNNNKTIKYSKIKILINMYRYIAELLIITK